MNACENAPSATETRRYPSRTTHFTDGMDLETRRPSIVYKSSATDRKLLRIIAVILSVFLGIAIISSGLSAIIFHLPIGLKIFKGSIGAATDSLAMIVGLYLVDVIGKLEMKVVK